MCRMYLLNEDDSYDQIRAKADARIADDRGRSRDHDFWIPRWERDLREHVTASRQKGDPCAACGEEWPCSAIRFILAPD